MKQNYRLKRDSFKASLPVICTGIQSKKCKYKFNETDASLRKRLRLWSFREKLDTTYTYLQETSVVNLSYSQCSESTGSQLSLSQ